MQKAIQQWLDKAEYDLSAAESLLASGHYLYVLFCCQQALEKTIKAIIQRDTKDHPPKIHSLARLAEYAKLELTDGQDTLLREMTEFYIKTRYPETISKLTKKATKAFTKQKLDETKELCTWLLTQL